MKRISFFILSFLILSSCQKEKHTNQHVLISNSEKQIMFFSDEKNIHKEGNYYDALLELKKKFPEEVSKMQVISYEENRNYADFQVESYPTLVIIKKNKIIEVINGDISKDEIIEPVAKALSN